MALIRRLIDVTFELGTGSYGESGFNTVTLTGLRVSANVQNAGGRSMSSADVRIWGMTLSKMNQLSSLGITVTAQRRNVLTLAAHNEGEPPATFFKGTIFDAWADLNSQPDVAFIVSAKMTLFEAVKQATPISIRGSVDVASVLSGVASQMGIPFVNFGVTSKLSTSYFAGSLRDQALKLVKYAGIQWNACENGVMAIWPSGGSKGGAVPIVSAETGMIGYPTFQANGIMLKTVYNPSIGMGTRLAVRSSLQSLLSAREKVTLNSTQPVSGEWVVYKLDHQLESLLPRGKWYSSILASPAGAGPFVAK